MTNISTTVVRPGKHLGTDVSNASTIGEATEMANLNWGLKVLPADHLTVMTDEGMTSTSIPGMRLVTRADNSLTLGVVGNRYNPLQNDEVFALGEHFLARGARPTEAGQLDGGRRVFMDFSIPDGHVTIGQGDLVKFSLSIRANHDGRGDVTAALIGRRLVCSNGMTALIPNLPHTFSVRHTRHAAGRMIEAEEILDGAVRYAKEFSALAQEMLDTSFTETEFRTYIRTLYPEPDKDSRAHALWRTRHDALLSLFRLAPTNELGRGTAWSAYNALTEYLDWMAPVRGAGAGDDDEADALLRARRQFDGTTQKVKDRGFALLAA
ncbi:DUF932 domain-containing protein [Brevibacterium aurantiacum]|uniref:DUF932 domain-containing protein n=1 Tax=Brevibacterium aurantiacum TaxID=273384 RepID=UPI003F8DAF8B